MTGRVDGALVLSLAFHAALLTAVAFRLDWPTNARRAGTQVVSIKAVAIDEGAIDAQREMLQQAQREREEQVRLAQEAAQREESARLAQIEREAEQEREAERQAQEQREAQERAAAQEEERLRLAEDQRKADLEAEKKRVAQAEAEKKRVAAQQAQRQREAEEAAEKKRLADAAAEKKRLEEEKKKAEAVRIARQKKEAAEAARRARESELSQMLDMERQRSAAVQSGQLDEYMAMVQQKIRRNWNKPANVREDLECVISVRQIVGGEVIDVNVKRCNGDQAVIRSMEAAIYKASPLPSPPDPSLFERVLEIVFVP